jgi:hypothetical protein
MEVWLADERRMRNVGEWRRSSARGEMETRTFLFIGQAKTPVGVKFDTA